MFEFFVMVILIIGLGEISSKLSKIAESNDKDKDNKDQ